MIHEKNETFTDDLIVRALKGTPLHDPPPGIHSGVMREIRFIPQDAPPLNLKAVVSTLAVSLVLLLAGLALIWFWMQRLASPETVLLLQMEAWYWVQRVEYQILLAFQDLGALSALLGRRDFILAWGLLSMSAGGLLLAGLGIAYQLQSHRIDTKITIATKVGRLWGA